MSYNCKFKTLKPRKIQQADTLLTLFT